VTAGTPDFIRTTRTSYDTIADDYTAQFSDHLADSPLERSLLGAFAEMVGGNGDGDGAPAPMVSGRRSSSDWDGAAVRLLSSANWAFTRESCTVACLMRRERTASPDARPTHTRTVIAYTITRDAIWPGGCPAYGRSGPRPRR
jgi:hypothetical protein